MVKISTKSLNRLSKTLVILLLCVGCGLPSDDDYVSPPKIVQKVTGSEVVLQFNSPSNGFVLWYQLIQDGATVDEIFSYDSEYGEEIFNMRGYTKNEKVNSTNNTFIWQPIETTVFPYFVTIKYPTNQEPYFRLTIEDSGSYSENFDVARYDEKKFTEIVKSDKDITAGITGVCSVAFATMNFKIDPIILKMIPSIGIFLDYSRGINVY